MTTGYIAWDDGLLGALLHGLMANIPRGSFTRRWVHGHQCTGCQHRVVCTCRPERQRELLLCPWCTPWVMEWAPVPVKPRKKRATRRGATRRVSAAVP
jgi:hypothetical protein